MNVKPLKTMKQVADLLDRPAHRIIHVCETEVVHPAVDAEGRGTVRRFSREDIFRIRLVLELQDAGVQIPLIKPLMRALDQFMDIYDVQQLQQKLSPFDLVSVIDKLSSPLKPMRAYLTMKPNRVALLIPGFHVTARHNFPLKLLSEESQLSWSTVTIVANLTLLTAEL